MKVNLKPGLEHLFPFVEILRQVQRQELRREVIKVMEDLGQ